MLILPTYTHIVNKKLKHTYLTFDEEANLIIKSPKVSQRYIEQLLLKKSSWINRSREKILQKKGKVSNFTELYFQGQCYPLILRKHDKKKVKFIFQEERFILHYQAYDETLFQKHIDKFYKEKATEVIPVLVDDWAETMNLSYNKLSFRKTKRQWGSCSGQNALSFNSMCMKLPEDVLQYIIVHELAHIKHKHHQKSFWDCVESYMPSYKIQVKALKAYTTY
jgi:predicted metal-dependent hydrolase